jgi:hypothetical protein
MGRKKKQHNKPLDYIQSEFIVYSDLGYYSGMAFGGEFQWSQYEKDAKPLNNISKYNTIRALAPRSIDVIFEYI